MTFPTPVHEATLRSHLAAFAVSIHPYGRLADIETRIGPDMKKVPGRPPARDLTTPTP